MKIIAKIRTDFPEKFGIPRQSGLVESLVGYIVFEPEFRNDDALRGIEEYSHLWLIWKFSESDSGEFRPTVRPPRLGGNRRVGVFATRSPFRPNPIGLSSVKLLGVEKGPQGTVLKVGGADLLDGTPIYDIKPYLSFTDSHPDAVCGFADKHKDEGLSVEFSPEVEGLIAEDKRISVKEIISQDPRPHYIEDGERVYKVLFSDQEIGFKVQNGIATVVLVNNKK